MVRKLWVISVGLLCWSGYTVFAMNDEEQISRDVLESMAQRANLRRAAINEKRVGSKDVSMKRSDRLELIVESSKNGQDLQEEDEKVLHVRAADKL